MELIISWWIIPTLITLFSFVFASYKMEPSQDGDYSSIGDAFQFIILYGMALIVSLVVWLIYFILNSSHMLGMDMHLFISSVINFIVMPFVVFLFMYLIFFTYQYRCRCSETKTVKIFGNKYTYYTKRPYLHVTDLNTGEKFIIWKSGLISDKQMIKVYISKH